MKAAAAVLAGSLLFFLGVLTGAGRQESLPPPGPIALGVGEAASGNPPPGPPDGSPPATEPSTTTTAGGPAGETPPAPTPPAPAPPASTPDRSRPSGSPDPSGSVTSTTRTSAPSGPTTTTTPNEPPTTATTAVEKVDSQVECTSPGNRGRGRQPCPPGTPPTGDQPRGGPSR